MQIDFELKKKLLKAKSQEEVRELLGGDASEDDIKNIWEEIGNRSLSSAKESLDDEELEAVSGGADRDFFREGCASTVKFSDGACSSNDSCALFSVTYKNIHPTCPESSDGKHEWLGDGKVRLCINCGVRITLK